MNLYEYNLKSRARQGLILQINDGFGEIAPLPGFSKETFEEAKQEILDVIYEKKTPLLPSVRFGLSCAQKSFPKSCFVPLCSLHKPREETSTLKLKLGHLTVHQAIELVHQYVGKYRLRLDCNRAWSLSQAIFFTTHFAKSDFEYLEEPVQTYSDLVAFSNITEFPVAVDETLREEKNIRLPTLKAAIIKPTLWGEIPNLDIPIILSSSYESSVGIIHIANLVKNTLPQGLDTFSTDFLNPPIEVKHGHLFWETSPNPVDTRNLCLIASVP